MATLHTGGEVSQGARGRQFGKMPPKTQNKAGFSWL